MNQFGPPPGDPSRPTNLVITSNAISSLICPEDDTLQTGAGNLSYAVNGGFSLWQGFQVGTGQSATGVLPTGWIGASGTGAGPGPHLTWGSATAKGTGVMFVGTTGQLPNPNVAGTYITAPAPWDVKTTGSSVTDGASYTLLLSENYKVGFSTGIIMGGSTPANWGAAFPTFTTIMASDNVCGGGNGNCIATPGSANSLTPTGGTQDGPGWHFSNMVGSFENINGGDGVEEGYFPYANSLHPGGINAVMCDGSTRFILDTIDGTVWSKVITPQGSKLPCNNPKTGDCYRQLPLPTDAIGPQ
jgi:prepilin-type processing-associated H-X9-DG protein